MVAYTGGAPEVSGFQAKSASGLTKLTVMPGWNRMPWRTGVQVRPAGVRWNTGPGLAAISP
jgi:hypothetical protein